MREHAGLRGGGMLQPHQALGLLQLIMTCRGGQGSPWHGEVPHLSYEEHRQEPRTGHWGGVEREAQHVDLLRQQAPGHAHHGGVAQRARYAEHDG